MAPLAKIVSSESTNVVWACIFQSEQSVLIRRQAKLDAFPLNLPITAVPEMSRSSKPARQRPVFREWRARGR